MHQPGSKYTDDEDNHGYQVDDDDDDHDDHDDENDDNARAR